MPLVPSKEDRSSSLGRRSKSRGGTLSRSSSQDSFKSARSEFRHTDAASSAAEDDHGLLFFFLYHVFVGCGNLTFIQDLFCLRPLFCFWSVNFHDAITFKFNSRFSQKQQRQKMRKIKSKIFRFLSPSLKELTALSTTYVNMTFVTSFSGNFSDLVV